MDNEKKIDGKLKELIMEWKFLGLSMEKLCEVILEKIKEENYEAYDRKKLIKKFSKKDSIK